MSTLAWLDELDDDDAIVLLSCLNHSINDFDIELDAAQFARAEAICARLDTAINGGAVDHFVARIPEDQRATLWASMWARVRDVHAPQDNMTEQQWADAEDILVALNTRSYPTKPSR